MGVEWHWLQICIIWVLTYRIYWIIYLFIIGNFLKIRNKGNRKKNFILWNFEDKKEWKNRGKTKEIFKTNIIF
jgi:hypothetical protein